VRSISLDTIGGGLTICRYLARVYEDGMRPAITASFRDTSIIVVGVIAIKNGYSDKVFLYTELCQLLMLLEEYTCMFLSHKY